MEIFDQAVKDSKNVLCYNGDLTMKEEVENFQKAFPGVERIMIGRGLLRNPGLVQEMKAGQVLSKEQLREYHDDIYQVYQDTQCGERNVLFRMKELWGFMIDLFEEPKKYGKKIRKSQKLWEYEEAVNGLFEERDFRRKF